MSKSEDLRMAAVKHYLGRCDTLAETEKIFGVSAISVERWVDRFEETGSVANKPLNSGFKKINPAKLRTYVKEHPDDTQQKIADAVAFIGLAAFCLFPVPIMLLALRHCFFDQLVVDTMGLLDRVIFPLVTLCAALVWALTLWNFRFQKRSVLTEARKNPTLILFFFLLVWMCVNFFFARTVRGGLFHGLLLRHESFSLILEYYLGFFVLALTLRDERMKRWLMRGLVGVSVFLVPCAFYLQRHITASEMYVDWWPSLDAVFTNPNYYGYFLSVAVGLSAGLFVAEEHPRWCVFHAVALALNSVALGYNSTQGAWIASLFACLFLVVACRIRDGRFNRRSLAALGLCTAFLGGAVVCGNQQSFFLLLQDAGTVLLHPAEESSYSAGSGRWGIWLKCLNLIRQNPLFGIGFEGIYVYNLEEYIGNTRPHNEYIQYALFYGIPAGILYTLGCLSVYLRALRYRARLDGLTLAALTAAAAYLTSAFFGVTVYNTAPFLFIMLGLGYVHGTDESHSGRGDKI